jgi:hypothetical protein
VSQQERGREVFAANVKHPQAELLRALVAGDTHQTTASAEEDEPLRRRLVALGAPLRGLDSLTVEPSEQMSTLVEGVRLARRDPVVARSLPLCFWRLRDALDMKALAALAFRPEDRHALGFMLELTGELGKDRRLVGLAEGLRDRRITLQRDFFQMFRRDAVIRDFPIAAKWGFRMNMDIDSFRALFDKFKRVPT